MAHLNFFPILIAGFAGARFRFRGYICEQTNNFL